MSTAKTAFAVSAMALLALAGGLGSAEAGGRHHHFHHRHFFRHHLFHNHFYGGPVYTYGFRRSCSIRCGIYKKKWLVTGDYFWKRKYLRCIGY